MKGLKGWSNADLPVEPEIAIHTEIESDAYYRGRLLQILKHDGECLLAAEGGKLDEIGNEIRCYRKSWYRTEAKKSTTEASK